MRNVAAAAALVSVGGCADDADIPPPPPPPGDTPDMGMSMGTIGMSREVEAPVYGGPPAPPGPPPAPNVTDMRGPRQPAVYGGPPMRTDMGEPEPSLDEQLDEI